MAKRRPARDPLVWTSIAAVLSVITAVFVYSNVMTDTKPPRLEDTAPPFALSTPDGATLTLASQLQHRDAVMLVFYRGYF